MYIVEVIQISTGRSVSPAFFTGENGSHMNLKDTISHANKFIKDNFENVEDYKVSYKIVGCL